MVLESLERKKIKNVCIVFWLPCLPCENGVKESKLIIMNYELRVMSFDKKNVANYIL